MKIGILGAGQLSRMLALAGIPLGVDFIFYDPKRTLSVTHLGQVIHAPYNDVAALKQFTAAVDVVTYENENIPLTTLKHIQQDKTVYPGLAPLKIMQDRLLEKNYLNQLGIPTTRYVAINNYAELIQQVREFTFPFLIKKRTSGYDGKGQKIINNEDELAQVTNDFCHQAIIEQFVPYEREISVIGCRDSTGQLVYYDICENKHRNGILFRTHNKPSDLLKAQAIQYLDNIMSDLAYVGVCTLELFVNGHKLLANEMAPRVHNSGHWTIEGAETSQFENHVRAVLGWPLGIPASHGEYTLYNILGEMPDRQRLLQQSNIHLHDYVKTPACGRKLGHITVANDKISASQLATIECLLYSESQ